MPDIHGKFDAPSDEEVAMMTDRMLAFIMPNTPGTDEEKEAFDKALRYQIAHEKTQSALAGETALPDGTTGFNIGEFSMSFADGAVTGLFTKRTMCPAAYGVLLRAGLLYRGIERC